MKGIVNGHCTIPRHACSWCRDHPGESGFPVECPEGYSKDRLPVLLGDLVARVATPIARALRLPCVDRDTGQLKPKSRCAARKRRLDKVVL